MFIIRWLLGRIILLVDFITSPKAPKLSTSALQQLHEQTAHLSLYQLPACPFCVKVRRAMKRQGLTLALKNINQDAALKEELIAEGGKRTVPCLKIAEQNKPVLWLYESKEIIAYLKQFNHIS